MKIETDTGKTLRKPNYEIDIEIRFPEAGNQKVTNEKPKQKDESTKSLTPKSSFSSKKGVGCTGR